MKTVSVRAKSENVARLRSVAEYIPGSSVNALVDMAIRLFLDVEAPAYIAAFEDARAKLERGERQPVRSQVMR